MQSNPQIKTSFSQKKANTSDDLAKNNQLESSDFFKQADPTFKVEQPAEPKPININSPLKTKKQENQKKEMVDLPVPPLGGGISSGDNQDSSSNLNTQGMVGQTKTNDPNSSLKQPQPQPQTPNRLSEAGFQQSQPKNSTQSTTPEAQALSDTPTHTPTQPQDQAQPQNDFSNYAGKPNNQEASRSKENKEYLLEQQERYNPELVEEQNKRLKRIIKFLVAFFVFLLIAFGVYYVYVYTNILKGLNINYYLKFLGLE